MAKKRKGYEGSAEDVREDKAQAKKIGKMLGRITLGRDRTDDEEAKRWAARKSLGQT
jgi:hypothetical protein